MEGEIRWEKSGKQGVEGLVSHGEGFIFHLEQNRSHWNALSQNSTQVWLTNMLNERILEDAMSWRLLWLFWTVHQTAPNSFPVPGPPGMKGTLGDTSPLP